MESYSSQEKLKKLAYEFNQLNDGGQIKFDQDLMNTLYDKYDGDLLEDLSKYVKLDHKNPILYENDLLLQKLKADNNIKLLIFFAQHFPDYDENTLQYSNNLYSLSICNEKSIISQDSANSISVEFSTEALVDLIDKILAFYDDYYYSRIQGLTPRVEK